MAENWERRNLLRDAAIDVLAGEGARKLTHRQVDKTARVPEGTTKNYFPTRNALLLATAQRAYQRYLDDLAQLESIAPPADRRTLAALLADIVRRGTADDRPRLLATVELHAEALRNPELGAVLAALTETDFAVYDRLQRAAGLPVTEQRSRTFTRSVHAALLSLLSYPPDALARIGLGDLDAFAHEIVDAVYPPAR